MIIASFLIGSGAGVAGLGLVWLALTLWFWVADRGSNTPPAGRGRDE